MICWLCVLNVKNLWSTSNDRTIPVTIRKWLSQIIKLKHCNLRITQTSLTLATVSCQTQREKCRKASSAGQQQHLQTHTLDKGAANSHISVPRLQDQLTHCKANMDEHVWNVRLKSRIQECLSVTSFCWIVRIICTKTTDSAKCKINWLHSGLFSIRNVIYLL